VDSCASIASLLEQHGLTAILARHEPRGLCHLGLNGFCRSCRAEMPLDSHLRESEVALLAQMETREESVAIQAWTHLIDDEPWLCPACQLLLP